MSNNIYDILGKLSELTPKEETVSVASAPIYESVAPRGDIISGIKSLSERYYKAQTNPQQQVAQQSDAVRYQSDNPLVKGFLQRAYQEFPNSVNDTEAIVALMAKDKQDEDNLDAQAQQWMQQAKEKIDVQQDKMNDMAQVIIDQEKRFQDFNKEVAAAKELSPKEKAQAAVDFAKVAKSTDAPAKGKQIVDKAKAKAKEEPKADPLKPSKSDEPEAELPAEPTAEPQTQAEPEKAKTKSKPKTKTKAKADKGTKENPLTTMVKQITDKPADDSAQDLEDQPGPDSVELKRAHDLAAQSGFGDESPAADLFDKPAANDPQHKQIAENAINDIKVDQETLDNVPMLRQKLRQDVRNFMLDPRRQMLTLTYPGGRNMQYPRQYIMRLAELLSTMDPAKKQNFFDNILPSADRFAAFIEQLKKEGNTYYFYKVGTPEQIIQAKTLKLGQTKHGSWYSANFPNPQAEKLFGPGRKWTAPSKPAMNEGENFLGNEIMNDNIYNILGKLNGLWSTEPAKSEEPADAIYESVDAKGSITEAVRSLEEKFRIFKEDAKPDFLDLDDDGDTEEPMKDAAKQAKEHEPAKVDKSAVEKRKRLQALKDKQEEKDADNWWDKEDKKSSTRSVKGHAYGGASQADDDEVDESQDTDDNVDYTEFYKNQPINPEAVKHRKDNQKRLDDIEARRLAKQDELGERAKNPYAIGMAAAKKKFGYGTKPAHDLPKKVITKGHEIAKSIDEGTQFKDTIKNSEAKMTKAKVKVAEGKEAIRNHPIYTDKNAWDHYKKELDEQEAMDEALMAPPVLDAQQELDEIASLAGLQKPRREPSCESCGCAESMCECGATMDPATMVVGEEDLLPGQRKGNWQPGQKGIPTQVAKYDPSKYKVPVPVKTSEDTMDEGNEFTKARLDAIAAGSDTFQVGGKTYNVSGDTSDERQQVEESTINEDVNVNITANGEEDAMNLIRKLAGMPVIAVQANPEPEVHAVEGSEQEYCDACDSTDCHCDQVDEERDVQWDNTPEELTAPISAAIPSGTDLNRSKRQDPATANKAANPLGESLVEENLWKAYESMINNVKA